MAWTYSGNPAASDKDKYRFLVGDTITTEPILSDAEIQFILDTYADNNVRLYQLFDACANIYARDVKKTLGPQSEDPIKRQEHFEKQADKYRKLASATGLSIPPYSCDKIFTKGMMNNV